MPESQVEQALTSMSFKVTGGLIALIVFIVSMTALMTYLAISSGRSAAQVEASATETHAALCALKADVQRRYDSSVEYLEKHPQGLVSSSGDLILSATEIRRSQVAQKSTLDALGTLSC